MTKYLRGVFLGIIPFTFAYNLYSQAPSVEWQRELLKIKSSYFDKFYSFKVNDGLLIAGNLNECDTLISGFHGLDDFFVLKLSGAGNILWLKVYGGTSNDNMYGIDISEAHKKIFISYRTLSTDGDFSLRKESYNSETGIIVLDFNGNEIRRISNNQYVVGDAIDNFSIENGYNNFIPSLGQKQLGVIRLKYSEKNDKIYLWTTLHDDDSQADPGFEGKTIFMSWDIDFTNSTYSILSTASNLKSKPHGRVAIQIDDISFDKEGNIFLLLSQGPDRFLFESNNFKKEILIPNFIEQNSDRDGRGAYFGKSCLIKLNRDLNFLSAGGTKVDYVDNPVKLAFSKNSDEALLLSYRYNEKSKIKKYGKSDLLLTRFQNDLSLFDQKVIATAKDETACGMLQLTSDNTAILFHTKQYTNPSKGLSKNVSKNPLFNFQENLSLENIVNYDVDPVGLRIALMGKDSILKSVNLNIYTSDAKLFPYEEDKCIISTRVTKRTGTFPILIGFDLEAWRVLWVKEPGNGKHVKILKVLEAEDGDICLSGLADIENIPNKGQVWLSNLSFNPEIKEKIKFQDKISSQSQGDTSLINSILQSRINADSIGENYRAKVFSVYQNDNTQTKALLAFALLSEYFGDYELAAKAYGILISKVDKLKDKANISKWRAHQITCNFLSQSKEKSSNNKNNITNQNKEGYYDIGIDFKIENRHLIVTKISQDFPAEKAGLKIFDEIIKINNVVVDDKCLSQISVKEMLRDRKPSVVALAIKRFGENNLLDLNITRSFSEPFFNNVVYRSNPDGIKGTGKKVSLNNNQKEKQSFLKKMIAAIQEDTLIMKNIAAAKKINYALAVLNKWSNEPVNKNYLLQIDEQLGMISSLVSIIKGSNPDFAFDNDGKVSFGSPDLKELVTKDYTKQEQTKFDASAKANETKIDDNISFVKKGNFNSYSGYYECYESSYSVNATTEAMRYEFCPTGESARRFMVSDDSPCEFETKKSYVKIIINGNKIYMSSHDEKKYFPCDANYNMGGNFHNISSTGGYINTISEGEGTIDFTTMKVLTKGTTKTNSDMGSISTTYGYGNHSKTQQASKGGANSNSRQYSTISIIEFLPENKIKFTSEENGNWRIDKKVKDL